MTDQNRRVSSGISGLNQMLSGLFIGDNVVWHDDAGSLAYDFCSHFIRECQEQSKPIVYVSFDRSPKNLIERLDVLAQNRQLTILDCFTNGKGDKAEVFNKFYEKDGAQWPYQVIKVTKPQSPQAVSDAVYGIQQTLEGDVRYVFESLTGMADLWGGEEHILKFYSHTCPQLYELDTIAYWIIEKAAHSAKLKAHINQIAQVAIDLSIDRGKTKIKLLKAENRYPKTLGRSTYYSIEDSEVLIEDSAQNNPLLDIGSIIKAFRKNQGMSQKNLSEKVGVTPSNISQIESGQVFPSIPALYRIASQLSVGVGSFFKEQTFIERTTFPGHEAVEIKVASGNKSRVSITQLTPFDHDGRIDMFLITLFGKKTLPAHFFQYKGEESGYLLSGQLTMTCMDQAQKLVPGDTVYLKTSSPTKWENKDKTDAMLLWMKIK